MRLLRDAGIRRFNIDLIAGLAGQTAESWRESLDWIERLDPGHVSVYMLEVDEDSRLGSEILHGGARYGAAAAPSEDLTVELYETAVERLAAMGLARYEISNFARPGQESLHNLKYWRLEPYAGFGADAHSFDGALRRAERRSRRRTTSPAGAAARRPAWRCRRQSWMRNDSSSACAWRKAFARATRNGCAGASRSAASSQPALLEARRRHAPADPRGVIAVE